MLERAAGVPVSPRAGAVGAPRCVVACERSSPRSSTYSVNCAAALLGGLDRRDDAHADSAASPRAGSRAYLEAAVALRARRVLLLDAAVVGWETWRAADATSSFLRLPRRSRCCYPAP